MILGCDAAGIDEDGNEVVVHAVISSDDWRGDETLDPGRSLLSERFQGTFAERVAVPRRNLIPKPEGMSFAQAACMPTAWLTAYRMLFVTGDLAPGQTVLVQGSTGGIASAAIILGAAAGLRVWVTGRSEDKRERALGLGAAAAFESGARLPERVDAVIESVGEATWAHSLRAVKPGRQGDRHRRNERPEPAGRAAARLLPAAADHRLDDGQPRRAPAADALLRRARDRARDRPRPADEPTPAKASPRWPPARWSARSSSSWTEPPALGPTVATAANVPQPPL